MTAAFCGHSSIVNLLLEAGADPNAPGPHQVKLFLDDNFAFSLFLASKGRVLFFLISCFYTLENFSRLHHLFGQLPRGTLTSSVLFYPKKQGTNRPNTIQDTIHYNIHYCFLTGPPQKEQKTFFHIIIFTRLKRNRRIMKSLFRFFKTQNFIFVYH